MWWSCLKKQVFVTFAALCNFFDHFVKANFTGEIDKALQLTSAFIAVDTKLPVIAAAFDGCSAPSCQAKWLLCKASLSWHFKPHLKKPATLTLLTIVAAASNKKTHLLGTTPGSKGSGLSCRLFQRANAAASIVQDLWTSSCYRRMALASFAEKKQLASSKSSQTM